MLLKHKLWYLIIGLLLFGTSCLALNTPNLNFDARQITFWWACNWGGLIFLSEYITRLLRSKSLLSLLVRNKKNLLIFIAVSTLGGLCVEGIGQWVGKLWFYPFFTIHQYKLATTLGFSLYMTTIAEVYIAAKSLVDRFLKPPRISRANTELERAVYPKLLLVGVLMIASSFLLGYKQYQKVGGYFFDATRVVDFHVNFWIIIWAPVGVWLVAEYFEYKRRQMSLLKDLTREYWNPALAILLATVVVGVSMELINQRYGYWVYVNWPLQQVKILNLPILMICLAWPLHFIMFLSIFRAIAAERSINVWSAYSPYFSNGSSKKNR